MRCTTPAQERQVNRLAPPPCTETAQFEEPVAFIVDKEELKPGLIIFRRTGVAHRSWYCRTKLPKADRYKTYSLKTANVETSREKAFAHRESAVVGIRYWLRAQDEGIGLWTPVVPHV